MQALCSFFLPSQSIGLGRGIWAGETTDPYVSLTMGHKCTSAFGFPYTESHVFSGE